MKIKPFKMRVTPEQSKKVQDIVQELSKEVWYRQDSPRIKWLYLYGQTFGWDAEEVHGKANTNPELTYTEFMELYTWEPKEGEMVLAFYGKTAWFEREFLFKDSKGEHWVKGIQDNNCAYLTVSIKRLPPKPQEKLDFMQIMGAV